MLELNKSNYEKEIIKHKGIAVVDYWAPWCGPCRIMAPAFEKLSKELGNKIKFAKVNVDENQEISASLGIMSIPTLIIFKNGKEADRIIGFTGETQLRQKLMSNL